MVARTKRRNAIKVSWGFDCTCAQCMQPSHLTKASDDRVRLIHDTEDLLDDWSSPESRRNKGVSPQMAEFVVSLYELERLYSAVAEGYYRAALAWNSVGNEFKARMWAERCAFTARINTGPMGVEATEMQQLARDPRKHWSWRWMYLEVAEVVVEEIVWVDA
jgi:hypothetical protein